MVEQRFPPPVGTAVSRLSNSKRVEEAHGDLDEHYDKDRMASLFKVLTYSMDDKRAGRQNPSNIPLENCDLYTNLAMYRGAVRRYREFRQRNGVITTSAGIKRQPRTAFSWPEWKLPTNEDLLQLARITVPYIRFLHPAIVRAVVDDNQDRREEWCSRLADRGIEPSLYLWEGSACAFPGVRRYAGSTEIAQHRRRMEVTAEPENALKLDDNSYPKAIWSFVFRGEGFKNEGPSGYSLAHLADHKKYKNRGQEEFDTLGRGVSPETFFGLFTSVANTVYMPSGLIRPTDFSFSLRNLIQRKALEIYGIFCKLLPPHLSIRSAQSDSWSLGAFQWCEPVGTLAHLSAFLKYRSEEMEKLLSDKPGLPDHPEKRTEADEPISMPPGQMEPTKQPTEEPERRRWWRFD
jgi:hypothetical protein